MKKIKTCNLCKRKNLKFLFNTKDFMCDVKGEYSLYECMDCGLVFVNPQPSMDDLEKHYPKNYYSYNVEKIPYEKLQIQMYKTYFSEKGNLFLKILFSPLKRPLRTIKIVPKGNFLDVGCGSGNFLQLVKKLGMDCYGVEPGRFDKEFAKKNNFKIFNGTLDEAKYKSNFFDSITLNHVFEHVEDPSAMMNELKRILKKDGLLRIAVPQRRSLVYSLFGKYWVQLDAPRHLYNYSTANLKEYASKAGLKVESVRYVSSPFQFIGSLSYIAREHNLQMLKKIFESKIFFILLFPISFICNRLQIGDSVEIVLTNKL